jgi:hypothetical protein
MGQGCRSYPHQNSGLPLPFMTYLPFKKGRKAEMATPEGYYLKLPTGKPK